MKLSQRLTRAGLTFILVGSIAAIMPQQSGAASAADPGPVCTQNGYTFQINDGSATYSQALGASAYYTSYLINTTDNTKQNLGVVTATNATGSNATFTNNPSNSVTVTAPDSGSGSVTLNATYTDSNSVTYNAAATIYYPAVPTS